MKSVESITSITTFQHKEIDDHYQSVWVEQSKQQTEQSNHSNQSNTYNMILPPPNITSTNGLHLGHAINITIQDVMGRYHILKGDKVTWIPGVDHAGIATQVVVEKQLMKDFNMTRHDIGRDKFLEKIWEWKDANCKTISNQIQTMCPVINYDLEQFTMSPELSKEVTTAFVRLYNDGLIHRDLRMVDFCCSLKTVISNIEVEELEVVSPMIHTTPNNVKVELGLMYEIKYMIDMQNLTNEQKAILTKQNMDHIIVSTTRPETMFGDVAVAVNPLDERFTGLENIGLFIPYTNRTIPIIYDTQAKMEMGTGAVKITPYHDAKDWACYQRCKDLYNLSTPLEVIDDDGRMVVTEINQNVKSLIDGKDRFICRKILLKQLQQDLLLVSSKPHKTMIRTCSRSGDILEPKLRYQWYIDTTDMSRQSIEAVDSGELNIIPDPDGRFKDTWKRFLSEGRSWCVSRQLWWGHRIPAYRIVRTSLEIEEKPEDWIIAESLEDAINLAALRLPNLVYGKDYGLYQDEDVLDTWFSSGIYPFAVLNGTHFPLNILETGKDILFFWVARMVMLSLALKNVLPFKTIYLHNIVRDKEGRKMSKSLGNVIDPLDIVYGISRQNMEDRAKNSNLDSKEITRAVQTIKRNYPTGISDYGVDSMRIGLVYYLRQSTDINLDPIIFKTSHAFLNKLWNVMMMYELYVGKITQKLFENTSVINVNNEVDSKNFQNLFKYMELLEQTYLDWRFYESNDFSMLFDNIHQYVMSNYCPFYLEFIKYVLANDSYQQTNLFKDVLCHMLKSFMNILVFLHPIAPNATAAMTQRLLNINILDVRPSMMLDQDMNQNQGDVLITFEKIRLIVHTINANKGKTTLDIESLIDDTVSDYKDIIMFLTR